MFVCLSERQERFSGLQNATVRSDNQQTGGVMNRSRLRSKLAKMIASLDKIIFDTSKQTCKQPKELIKHRQRLVHLLNEIEAGEAIDWNLLLVVLYRTVVWMHSLVF